MDFSGIIPAIPGMWNGMVMTLQLMVMGVVGGIVLGTILALMRLSSSKLLSRIAGAYVNYFRSIPLLLVITWFYLAVPFVLRWIIAGGPEIWAADEFLPALLQTLMYGLAGALATTVVAFPMAYLAVRHPSWFSKALELSNYITSSLPGIVVGLAFVTVSIKAAPDLYQTSALLVAAYVLLFLPRALVNIRSGLAQAPKELDEAAQALGKTPLLAFLRVTLRLTAPAAAGGAALVFLAIVNELTATLLLSPNGTRTLATEFWSKSSEIDYAGAAPYALLMILISAPMTYLLFQQSKKAAGQ